MPTVAAAAEQARPLRVGQSVPANSTLTDIDGKPFDLNHAIASKPTVLIFYRGGWCPFCNNQMSHLEEIEPQLESEGYQLLAISPDKPESLKASIAKHTLTYTLLSDSSMNVTTAFGLAYKVDDDMMAKMKTFGVDLDAATGNSLHELPVPAAYVIDKTGVIRFEYANPDFRVRVNPDDLMAAAKKYSGTSQQ